MSKKRMSISSQFSVLLTAVVVTNGIISYFMLQNVYQQELKAQAQTVVANVEAFGSWVAKNGRIWVKDNPDSYLGEMELTDPENNNQPVHFYSKNPALAQREFSEAVSNSASPAKFRMTSSNVMNPANIPDVFERRALYEIENGKLSEYYEVVDGAYRYASPVYHKESCIGCHGDSRDAPADVIKRYGNSNGFGFAVGDVAGIISVTIPKRNLLHGGVSVFAALEMAAILLSIAVILFFVRRVIIKPVSEVTLVAEKISRGETFDFRTDHLNSESKNEIDQLALATGRMRTSFNLAMRKMNESRKAAAHAVKVAKTLKAQQQAPEE